MTGRGPAAEPILEALPTGQDSPRGPRRSGGERLALSFPWLLLLLVIGWIVIDGSRTRETYRME